MCHAKQAENVFEGLLCMVVHVISRLVTTGCGLLKVQNELF